ncbi:MAG: alpha/beta hydrolase [Thermoguttaceae bacterium]|nr:alpha/beta hydrolase [Thermoguttaceae bacterium]MDW8077318.1 alpha/beta hydrolase [Thermoguttaceae bacterium]
MSRAFLSLGRSVIRFVIVVGLCWATLLALAMLWEEAFIFFPSPYPEGDWTLPPGTENAEFTAADGTRLHGWFREVADAVGVVLYCHGNAGNVTHRAAILQCFAEITGASILVFDYRGYGKSEGRPTEAGILADTRAARAWLARRTGVAERDVVLAGQSLGGAVAAVVAGQDGAKALILENTFTSIRDMAAYHYPLLPVGPFLRTKLDALAHLHQYAGPVLIAHAEWDSIVPFQHGQRLFDAARGPKEFFVVPEADHNDPMPLGYYRKVREFLIETAKLGDRGEKAE